MTDTYFLWHGGHHFQTPVQIKPSSTGNHEHGPGLYLTTNLSTAIKYAKGGGSTIIIELSAPIRWLEDAKCSWKEMDEFLKNLPRLKNRDKIREDLKNCHLRHKEEPEIFASYLVNLMVNYEYLSGKSGVLLAEFLVEHGIDASCNHCSSDEDWVVLFNPDIVIKAHKKIAKEIDWDKMSDFGTIEEQNKRMSFYEPKKPKYKFNV